MLFSLVRLLYFRHKLLCFSIVIAPKENRTMTCLVDIASGKVWEHIVTRKINIGIPISCRCLNHDNCRTHDVARKGKKEASTKEAVRLSVNTYI